MGLTADDLQQQATSRGEEEASISANSISSSCIDTRSSNPEYGSEGSQDCSSPSDKQEKWCREEILEHQQQQCQRLLLLRKREGLLDITVRTVNLVRRNQQLQHRLAALQAETRAFVRSVLNNPENQAVRELTSRSKRKSRNEDENEDNSSKRLKLDSVTSTTIATAATTNSATKLEQDPAISESDNNQK
ncbi:hypothetical protein B7P43_G10956 [Cryptotermes secundus]|uniref:Uncharacterized protein n=2 Tax=Cryptotermes secundus TaxID=105785 RepID=A0A2J7RNM6_9NEOP|nr:hypothetical protein B7P43_G10956 [Cryptotermes secundus]